MTIQSSEALGNSWLLFLSSSISFSFKYISRIQSLFFTSTTYYCSPSTIISHLCCCNCLLIGLFTAILPLNSVFNIVVKVILLKIKCNHVRFCSILSIGFSSDISICTFYLKMNLMWQNVLENLPLQHTKKYIHTVLNLVPSLLFKDFFQLTPFFSTWSIVLPYNSQLLPCILPFIFMSFELKFLPLWSDNSSLTNSCG